MIFKQTNDNVVLMKGAPVGTELVELTHEWYLHLRDCVPPKSYDGNSFFVGEPWMHNDENIPLFHFCFACSGKYYMLAQPQVITQGNTKLCNNIIRIINKNINN